MNSYKKFVCVGWVSLFLVALGLSSSYFAANAASDKQDKISASGESSAATQSAARTDEARKLTTTLLALNDEYQVADQAEQPRLLDELSAVAAKRQQLLSELIERDPAELLRVALPADLRSNLPAEILDKLEQETELKGELEVLYQCGENESRLSYFLKTADERLPLHFVTSPTADLQTGTTVRVQAVRIGQLLVLEASSPNIPAKAGLQSASIKTGIQAITTIQPNTFGEQRVLVLLVNFQDNQTQPYTLSQARDLVFSSVSNFYREASYQQAWLTGDVFGWFTLPINGSCDNTQVGNYANQAAAAAGVDVAAYNRFVYIFPKVSCSWSGVSTVGGNPSQLWINGSMQSRVVAHEMGHSFGLTHSKASECGSTTIGSSCTTIEYGDTIDVMGNYSMGHFHTFQKERLGWLDYGSSPPILTVQAGGTYWIDPYESLGSNPKALKILRSLNIYTGARTWYYVEFRRPVGADNFLSSNNNVLNGVVIHSGSETLPDWNYLLDMTPETSSWFDPALVVGQGFSDPDAGVTITTVSVSSTGAAVNVAFGSQPCTPANPTLALSPSQSQWVAAGTTVTYTVSVTNRDSASCASSGFNLQATVPIGWTAVFAAPTLSIAPGASATTTLQVTSPSGTIDGFYSIGLTAANSSNTAYSASTSATYVVGSSLAVAVSSDKPSYTRTQTVSLSSLVNANGSPVSGASVTITITKSNGSTVTGTVTTGSNGSAVYSYRFNKQKDPIGTYQAKAAANLNGVSGSATTSFTVQ